MDDRSRELVDRTRAGDPAALHALLEAHLPALRSFVRQKAGQLVRAKETSMDLVQTVCREVLEDLGDFEYRDEAAFRSWLYTTALHKIIDRGRFYRRAKRNAAEEAVMPKVESNSGAVLLDACASFGTPSQDAAGREQIERIERAFAQLPEEYRAAITRSRLMGMTYAEIGCQIGRSEEAVRKLIARGLVQLAKLLEGT